MILEPLHIELARQRSVDEKVSFLDALADILQVHIDELVTTFSQAFSYPILSFTEMKKCVPTFDFLPFSHCQSRLCVVQRSKNSIRLIITNPFNTHLMSWAGHIVSLDNIFICTQQDMQSYLIWCETESSTLHIISDDSNDNINDDTDVVDLSLASVTEDQNIIVKIVNTFLYDSIKLKSSDIHLETNAHGMHVKYRIDGMLVPISQLSNIHTSEQVISRLKVLSNLDTSERRVPQDGAFKAKVGRRSVDFRVSIIPGVIGEDAVIRVLDKQSLTKDSEKLNFNILGVSQDVVLKICELLARPHGMFLVTGPTGSGKTTTLYACLTHLNTGERKIISIEDPVEYRINNILQILVNHKQGLTFERGLRSVLRHDPDVIMVGEIRDLETAQIAIQAALTGHLVLTTVHANNVFDVIGRFLHMGTDIYSFVTALNGVLGQRLVRCLCTKCRRGYTPKDEDMDFLRSLNKDIQCKKLWRPRGCSTCRGSGYKGRSSVAEILVFNDELRDLIVKKSSIAVLKERAHESGLVVMQDSAIDLLLRGMTSIKEIQRVMG